MPINFQSLNQFKIANNQVILNQDYLLKERKRFKKITGTKFAAIVGLNKYNSPFKVWMSMVNLYKDTMDPTLARTGNVIEPKVRNYVTQQLNIPFRVYDPKAVNYDVFSSHPIFGGIPDGEPLNQNQQVDYSTGMPMLEIKTSSIDSLLYKRERNELKMVKSSDGTPVIKEKNAKKKTWFLNEQIIIPNEYCLQIGLYLYLRQATHAVFGIAFLEPQDYVQPEAFQATDQNVYIAKCELQLAQMKPYIDYAIDWYHKYIEQGVSPKMTEEDSAWLKTELEGVKS